MPLWFPQSWQWSTMRMRRFDTTLLRCLENLRWGPVRNARPKPMAADALARLAPARPVRFLDTGSSDRGLVEGCLRLSRSGC